MLKVLNGLPIYSVSRLELETAINLLLADLRALKTELDNRRDDDSYHYGYRNKEGVVTSWPTTSEAYDAARNEFGEGGEYRITRVYKIK